MPRKRSEAGRPQAPICDSCVDDGQFGQFPGGQPAGAGMASVESCAGFDGEQLTVTWGKELFQPLKFHNFEVGSFVLTVTIRQGETVAEAAGRAQRELEQLAHREFREKLAAYLERVRTVSGAVSAMRNGGAG